MKDLARQRTIERLIREKAALKKVITFLLIIIVFLLVLLVQPSYAQTYQTRSPKGCISFFDSTIYINNLNDSIFFELEIEKKFFFKGSDHYRIKSGKYRGFFVMTTRENKPEKAFLIVAGNQRGEHFTQWYFFRKQE